MQDEMLESFMNEMINIIGEISKKILRREIDTRDEYLLTLFAEALEGIKAENFVTVTVSESQAGFALRNIDLFKAKVANIPDFKIISDENAERGTMIVETAKTVADASFGVQMDDIDAILERMKANLTIDAEQYR
jgi:flagellar biosynthesis/type III secretory pathway protein FliH